MKKLAITLTLCLITSTLLAETTERQFYTEIDALYLSSPGDFDGEQTMGFTVGYEWYNNQAIEAELQINGLDSMAPGYEVDADIFTYLVGYRYSLMRDQNRHVYLGFGFGIGDAEIASPLQNARTIT